MKSPPVCRRKEGKKEKESGNVFSQGKYKKKGSLRKETTFKINSGETNNLYLFSIVISVKTSKSTLPYLFSSVSFSIDSSDDTQVPLSLYYLFF